MINLSGKVNPTSIEMLQAISDTAARLNLQFFIIGATARDLILHAHHHIPLRRGTMDIDLGFQVANWDVYTELVDTLSATGLFNKTQMPHRLLYCKEQFIIDIVPFGRIMDTNGTITCAPGALLLLPKHKTMTAEGIPKNASGRRVFLPFFGFLHYRFLHSP